MFCRRSSDRSRKRERRGDSNGRQSPEGHQGRITAGLAPGTGPTAPHQPLPSSPSTLLSTPIPSPPPRPLPCSHNSYDYVMFSSLIRPPSPTLQPPAISLTVLASSLCHSSLAPPSRPLPPTPPPTLLYILCML